MLPDLRYALRQMRRSPWFTATAVITLALGIGANVVIFTLIDSILLRPLPYERQDRLVLVTASTAPAVPKGWIRALAANSRSFAGIAGYGQDAEWNVSDAGQPYRVFGSAVTVNAFDLLGVRPAAGRFFPAVDAVAGQDNDVVLSHDFWRQRYGGDASAVGRSIRIDGVWRRIVGVMPAGMHFPYADTQFVIPVSFRGADSFDAWSALDLHAMGRLNDGATAAQAQAELRNLHGVLLPMFPWRMPDIWASDMTVTPLLESLTGPVRPQLLLLFGAVGLILLIACANVANMVLARASGREREMAIRGALGASQRRIFRQLISESLLLGVAAGTVALAGAWFTLHFFVQLLPADTPRLAEVSLHPRDAAFTFFASLVAGILFGFLPAIRMAAPDLMEALRMGSRGMIGRSGRFGLLRVLVVAQIGLSVVIVTAAGLMLRSLYNLSQVDPGFRTEHTIAAEVSLDAKACAQRGRCHAFYSALLDRLKATPGVENAAVMDALPLSGRDNNYVFDAELHPRDAEQGALLATGRVVTPGYLQMLGLAVVRGRLLTQEDTNGSTHAVVVNQRMAERLWPNQDPIGKHVISVEDEPSPAVWNQAKASVVVGVVGNARESSLSGAYTDEVYLPLTPGSESSSMHVLMQTRMPPTDAAAALRSAVASIDAEAPVTHLRSLAEVVAGSVAGLRALSVLLFGFGVLAVSIGAVGVYSLIAYIVSWRSREFGLRLALGSTRRQIELLVLRQSLALALAGCLAGLCVSVFLGQAMQAFLFEVHALDPVTYGAVPVLMAAIALLAGLSPALRAAAIEPMQALRAE